MKTYYATRKEAVRNEAIDWSNDFSNRVYSWSEIAAWTERFRILAKRYGLVREFTENTII